ncbi:MAG TPA: dicarboxylate/amino acid:cation symporter [Gemmatimonadota bacterium]|nr:dicarboxylate/amino acid:cation symporter [Gemmatimonadota bacterium]
MRFPLHTQIFLGLVLGAIAGVVANALGWGDEIQAIKPIGDAFIRLITMLVVPLVFASLLVGVASLGDLTKLGRIGTKTIAYYLTTTAIAITIGLTLGNIVKPGSRLDPVVKEQLFEDFAGAAEVNIERAATPPSVVDTLIDIIPTNPAASLAEAHMLQIIFFALLFGIALTYLERSKSEPILRLMEGINDAVIQLVHLVMKLAPYGVFALIAAIIGQYGLGILRTLIVYSVVVVVALFIHMGIVYPTAVRLFAGMSPVHFFKGIAPAQLVAFSTSSSNATLPVTMECAEENLGVSEEVSAFVLPLGATINMDGTALYQGTATIFIAQVYGLELTITQQLMVLLTATLASIGAAGVPGVGMITLALVLKTVGVPLEGIALILGVDRILDMCRTMVNITGDASCAVVVAASEGELEIPAPIAPGGEEPVWTSEARG